MGMAAPCQSPADTPFKICMFGWGEVFCLVGLFFFPTVNQNFNYCNFKMHCCKAWPSATPGGGQVFCRVTWLEGAKTRAVLLLLLRKVSAKELSVPESYS